MINNEDKFKFEKKHLGKVKLYNLTSDRFNYTYMSESASESIKDAKLKQRSDIKLGEWAKLNYIEDNWCADILMHPPESPMKINYENYDDMSLQDFQSKYENLNKPLIIKGVTNKWLASTRWNFEGLYNRFKDSRVKIGEDDLGYKIKIKFKYFLEYMIHNRDDSPLYLFESSIENHKELKSLIDDYVVPKYFMEDLFKYVGNDRRPPYRWFLIGPERSGTTIHIDPLGTSAWNTSIFGYKLWLLLPPEIPKSIAKGKDCLLPGEDDEAIMYFRNIFPRLKLKYPDMKEIIFVQKPGETVYIPGGWWHTVVNLSDTIAITQNYCSSINFPQVWKCVRKERKKMSVIFLKQLKIHRPDLYKLALEMNEKDGYIMYNKNDQFLKKKRRDRRESDNSDSSSSSSSSTLNSDEFDY